MTLGITWDNCPIIGVINLVGCTRSASGVKKEQLELHILGYHHFKVSGIYLALAEL